MTGRQNRTARLLGAELPLPAPITVETQQLLVANPLALARQCKLNAPPPVLEVELVADQRTVTTFRIDSRRRSPLSRPVARSRLPSRRPLF
jgi:hypothetical protein